MISGEVILMHMPERKALTSNVLAMMCCIVTSVLKLTSLCLAILSSFCCRVM